MRWLRAMMPVFVALTVCGLALLGTSAAGAQASEDDPAEVEAGQAVFESSCAGCHGVDGEGTSNGRPLLDVADEAGRGVHIASIRDGKGGMPPFGENLSDEEISQVASYVRLTFVSESAQELPRTGATTWTATIGASLLAIGLAIQLALGRRLRISSTLRPARDSSR